MSCFWCPNWLHISSFRDKAVSHLASGIFVFNAVAPCKDFPLLPQDVPALLVRRSPHWRAAHTQSRLRPQWEVLRKQEVGDNVWDQRLRWVGEIYFDSTWFSPCSCFICIMVGTITSKEIAKPSFTLPPAEDNIFCTTTLGVPPKKKKLNWVTQLNIPTKSCWLVGVKPSCEMNGPEWLTYCCVMSLMLCHFCARPRWLSRWAAALCAHGGHPHSCRRFLKVTVKWRSALSPKAQKERHFQDRLLTPPLIEA